jgi:hypothetical protein
MIQGTGHLFGVLGVLTIGDAFASVSSREIADLAGQLSDGVDWGFFSLFLWKVRSLPPTSLSRLALRASPRTAPPPDCAH